MKNQHQVCGLALGLLLLGASAFAADTPNILDRYTATITGGTINNTVIGNTTPAAGSFTTINGNTLTTGSSTYTGTAAQTYTFPTTSATIARTDAANTFTGHQTIEGVTSTGATGTGKFVFDGTPTLVTPVLGVASGTSLALTGTAAVGGALATGVTLALPRGLTGATSVTGAWISSTIASDATSNAFGFRTNLGTAAAAFTVGDVVHYYANQGTVGASSAITSQYGYLAESSLTGATNNYGFKGNIAAATGRWNFFASGTADNAFAGNVRVGSAVAPTVALDVTGAVKISGSITPSGHIISGGTVPTIANNDCGTATQGTITAGGNDNAFLVTVGTAAVTSCVITFQTAWAAAPRACTISPANSTAAAQGVTLAYISAISTTQVTLTGSAMASAAYYVTCL